MMQQWTVQKGLQIVPASIVRLLPREWIVVVRFLVADKLHHGPIISARASCRRRREAASEHTCASSSSTTWIGADCVIASNPRP